MVVVGVVVDHQSEFRNERVGMPSMVRCYFWNHVRTTEAGHIGARGMVTRTGSVGGKVCNLGCATWCGIGTGLVQPGVQVHMYRMLGNR